MMVICHNIIDTLELAVDSLVALAAYSGKGEATFLLDDIGMSRRICLRSW
jgi:hypothetical protein